MKLKTKKSSRRENAAKAEAFREVIADEPDRINMRTFKKLKKAAQEKALRNDTTLTLIINDFLKDYVAK